MAFWTRAETEMLVNISSAEPHDAYVSSNWPYYNRRLKECEGFSETKSFSPEDGGESLEGRLSIAPYAYIYLRSKIAEGAQRRYEQEKAGLPELHVKHVEYRPDSFSRETLIHALAEDPYWLHISTDMDYWLRALSNNPCAQLLEETVYSDPDDHHEGIGWRYYVLPRSLMTIRKRRPQISDERRRELSKRLAGFRRRRAA